VERLKRRQSGLTPRHHTILEGVYELEPRPDWWVMGVGFSM